VVLDIENTIPPGFEQEERLTERLGIARGKKVGKSLTGANRWETGQRGDNRVVVCSRFVGHGEFKPSERGFTKNSTPTSVETGRDRIGRGGMDLEAKGLGITTRNQRSKGSLEINQRNRNRQGLVDGVGKVGNNKVIAIMRDDSGSSEEPEGPTKHTSELLDIGRISKNLSTSVGIDSSAKSLLEESNHGRVGRTSKREALDFASLAAAEG